MGVFSDRRGPGSVLVHMHEIFGRLYGSEIFYTDSRGDDLQFPVSVPGDKEPASGDRLRGLDRDRSPGGCDRGHRAV